MDGWMDGGRGREGLCTVVVVLWRFVLYGTAQHSTAPYRRAATSTRSAPPPPSPSPSIPSKSFWSLSWLGEGRGQTGLAKTTCLYRTAVPGWVWAGSTPLALARLHPRTTHILLLLLHPELRPLTTDYLLTTTITTTTTTTSSSYPRPHPPHPHRPHHPHSLFLSLHCSAPPAAFLALALHLPTVCSPITTPHRSTLLRSASQRISS